MWDPRNSAKDDAHRFGSTLRESDLLSAIAVGYGRRAPLAPDAGRIAPEQDILTIEIVGADGLAQLRDEWTALFACLGSDNPFLSYEWADVCCRHTRSGVVPVFPVARRAGNLAGVASMQVVPTRPWGRKLAFLGPIPPDYGGVLADRSDAGPVIASMMDELIPAAECERVELFGFREGVPDLGACESALGRWSGTVQALAVTASPLVRLDGDFGDYMRTRPRRTRAYLNRAHNRLERENVSVNAWRAQSIGPPLLTQLFEVHVARHVERTGASQFEHARIRDFLTDLTSTLGARGWLDVAGLEIDGRLAAFVYGMRLRDTFLAWMTAFRPSLSCYCPGNLLWEYVIRSSCEADLGAVDFMVGTERYKDMWATQRVPVYTLTCDLGGPGIRRAIQSTADAGRAFLKRSKDQSPTLRSLWRRLATKA